MILAPVAASTPQQGGEKAKGPNAEFEADMGELNSRLATIVDRNSGILNENKHLKETMDLEKKKYADEVIPISIIEIWGQRRRISEYQCFI